MQNIIICNLYGRHTIFIMTALIHAVRDVDIYAVKVLLEHPSTDVNAVEDWYYVFHHFEGGGGRVTALMMAAALDEDGEITRMLLAAPGIDVNYIADGMCALDMAAEWNNCLTTTLLADVPDIDLQHTLSRSRQGLSQLSEIIHAMLAEASRWVARRPWVLLCKM